MMTFSKFLERSGTHTAVNPSLVRMVREFRGDDSPTYCQLVFDDEQLIVVDGDLETVLKQLRGAA